MCLKWLFQNWFRNLNYFLILYIWIIVGVSQFGHYPLQTFVDTIAYTAQSSMNIASFQFWLGGLRPFSYPLVLRGFQEHSYVSVFQFCFWFFSWVSFAFISASLLNRLLLKYVWLLIVASISLSTSVFPWNALILTESLSISGFLWMVSGFLLIYSPLTQAWKLLPKIALSLGLITLAIFWQFSRDANAYFTLIFSCVLLFLWAFRKKWRLLITPTVCMALFLSSLLQIWSANKTKRWKIPLLNVLGQRILTNPVRISEFELLAMPVNKKVMCFKNQWHFNCNRDYSGFGNWLSDDGKKAYTQWLLHHPIESWVEVFTHWRKIVGTEVKYYTFEPYPLSTQIFNYITPLDRMMLFFLLVVLFVWFYAGVRIYKTRADVWVLIPWSLLLATIPLAFICYHADADEVERHCLPIRVNLHLLGWLCIIWTADRMRPFCPQLAKNGN